MSSSVSPITACPYCCNLHQGKCPLVSEIEYYENGLTKRVKFFESVPRGPHTDKYTLTT